MRYALPVLMLAAACTRDPAVQVYAAASTEAAVMMALGSTARVNAAASSTLARQIEAGAPADIALLANEAWITHLDDAGFLDGPPLHPFTNTLVVVVPATDTASVGWMARMQTAERVALGDPEHVPAGQYAADALRGAGLWESVRRRTIATADVRAAAALVARGEVPIGIVYATDVAPGLRVIHRFARDDHPPITYAMAIVKGRRTKDVEAVFERLRTSDAFERLGFERIEE